MLKLITSVVVAGSCAFATCQETSACGGGRCGGRRSCAPAAAAACDMPAAAPATPDMPGMEMPPAAPSTAQNTQSQFRSYSYDPAPAYVAPAQRIYSRPYSSQQNQFSAGRKMRGL